MDSTRTEGELENGDSVIRGSVTHCVLGGRSLSSKVMADLSGLEVSKVHMSWPWLHGQGFPRLSMVPFYCPKVFFLWLRVLPLFPLGAMFCE